MFQLNDFIFKLTFLGDYIAYGEKHTYYQALRALNKSQIKSQTKSQSHFTNFLTRLQKVQ